MAEDQVVIQDEREMSLYNSNSNTAINTASGTLLAIFANIHSEDIVKTTLLACIGAIISFVISLGLKWISKKITK